MMNKILFFCFPILVLSSCTVNDESKKLTYMEINQNWEFRQVGKENWLPVSVPGTVHTDLLANKVIADPYYRLNEKQLQWIDKADWEYRTVFSADEKLLRQERQELVFEGLDTYADIYLNDELIQKTDNMFRIWTIDISKKLRKGQNILSVILKSPTRIGLESLKAYGIQLPADNDQSETGEMGQDKVSPYVRKAPYHFGWDWGPRLVTSGIWRPVKLRAWSDARINDVNIVTEDLSTDEARLTAKLELDVAKAGEYFVRVIRDSIPQQRDGVPQPGDGVPVTLKTGKNVVEIPVTINNPTLWQPNGYGEQKLYHFHFELLKEQKTIDSKEVSTGLRTLKLVQQPDPDGKGRSFYFEVNGKPVFAKGANYIPNDVFLTRVRPETYEFIVKSAAEANMNMLRVWGGGIYENDLFYDLCDKYGIMVWQDFMFACAMYPGNDAFLENVRQEAIDNVKRLRNHPCLAIWCGNNEIEIAWGEYEDERGWGWKQRYDPEHRLIIWKAYDTLFHHILPDVVSQEDPGRPYWHSSPSAGMGKLASYETTSGDMHYWGVWHGLHPLTDFRKYRARFMSEYGFQSFPEFNSVKKYTVPEDYSIESEVMMSHQRSGIGNLRIKQYMEADYKIPADFEKFLYVGQLLQAEAIKLAIEAHRSDKPYCMGSLYWQINDCWPVASWSGIDYYGRWKALHYTAREAFKPTVLVCSEDVDLLKIKVVSDFKETGNLKLDIRLLDFAGRVLWKSENEFDRASKDIEFSKKEILGKADPASVVLVSELKNDDKTVDTDLHYFARPKDIKLKDPQLTYKIDIHRDTIEINLHSVNLAKNVFLYGDGINGQFSDNFFDILPGQEVSVTIPKRDISSDINKSLKILHLYMTDNHR